MINRRNFLRSMLGVAAATALPSEVWPFKKIFLPTALAIVDPWDTILAVEMEHFSRSIPDLLFRPTPFYQLLKKRGGIPVSSRGFRIPMRDTSPRGRFIWTPNEDQSAAIAQKQAQGIDVQAAIDAFV